MARSITAAVLAQLASAVSRPIVMVEAQFTSGVLYLWSGYGTIAWNSQTWLGTGELGKISRAQETTELRADNLTLSLSGIPSSLLTAVLGEVRPNYPVKVWYGYLDDAGAVLADPLLAYSGLMDVPSVVDGKETCSVSITVENHLADLLRVRERRLTDQDQQQLYTGDKFCEFVARVQDWNGTWNKGPAVPSGTDSGGGGGMTIPEVADFF